MSKGDCPSCDGFGKHYGGHVCDACMGIGKKLTPEERQMLDLVNRLINIKLEKAAR